MTPIPTRSPRAASPSRASGSRCGAPTACLVTGTDLDGDPRCAIEVDGWRARIMQHEFDHLDGVLYVDRLGDGDWKTVQKIARKRGWGRPGEPWTPGVDDIDA